MYFTIFNILFILIFIISNAYLTKNATNSNLEADGEYKF